MLNVFNCNNMFGVVLLQMHSSMCLALKKLVDRVMKIFPEIEAARPGSSTAIQPLNEALEKAKLLLQYCSESSKLYMVCQKLNFLSHFMYFLSLYVINMLLQSSGSNRR